MKKLSLLLAMSLPCAASCASDYKIYDDTTELNGFPVRLSEVYYITGFYTKHSKGEPCDPKTPFVKTIPLPTGREVMIEYEPSQFANSEFSLDFNESGTLKSFKLNSEPVSETVLDSLSSFITDAGPYIGLKSTSRDSSDEPDTNKSGTRLPACDAGPIWTSANPFKPFDSRGE